MLLNCLSCRTATFGSSQAFIEVRVRQTGNKRVTGMSDIRYTEDHEWVLLDGDEATIGISDYAQEQLGDIVFVELPDIGKAFAKGDEASVVESVKAASEVYAPITGTVTEINEALSDDPELVNNDATGDGWFYKMKVDDASAVESLMTAEAYDAYVSGLQ